MIDTKTDSQAVLLIESDPLAAMTISHALVRHEVHHPVICASDSEDALLKLRHHLHERPCLILVDTQCNGLGLEEFLGYLMADSALAQVPVVALGVEPDQQLESLLHRHGIADVVAKASDYAELSDQIGRLVKYWTELRLAAVAA
ncbi:hypothetical protein ACFL6U_31685 [Planctomycetota bacterium]